jgi:hypothetical protein
MILCRTVLLTSWEASTDDITVQLRDVVDCVWNVMAHAQKPDFILWRNRRVHLNWHRCQFSWLLAAEVCTSAVVMLDTPCSEVVWRVLSTHSIRQFHLHFPSCVSLCAITFQLNSSKWRIHPNSTRAWQWSCSEQDVNLLVPVWVCAVCSAACVLKPKHRH